MMEDFDPKEFLIFALKHFDITIISQNENMITLAQNYTIEIEGKKLFKLSQEGQVIAPFDDVEELCNFIKKDMQLNEKN